MLDLVCLETCCSVDLLRVVVRTQLRIGAKLPLQRAAWHCRCGESLAASLLSTCGLNEVTPNRSSVPQCLFIPVNSQTFQC